ncbi:MAG TPA: Hpt domain-containing protein [Candidatus Binatia bacterium]|jgi:HPt (histidine-containing phosphotransfer) domain-containing protein
MMLNNAENGRIVVRVDRDLEDLIPNFMANRQNDLIIMRHAIDTDDYETVRSLAHGLKGAGGGYGFDALTEIAAAIEQAAKTKDSRQIRAWLTDLADYLEKVEIVYE